MVFEQAKQQKFMAELNKISGILDDYGQFEDSKANKVIKRSGTSKIDEAKNFKTSILTCPNWLS